MIAKISYLGLKKNPAMFDVWELYAEALQAVGRLEEALAALLRQDHRPCLSSYDRHRSPESHFLYTCAGSKTRSPATATVRDWGSIFRKKQLR